MANNAAMGAVAHFGTSANATCEEEYAFVSCDLGKVGTVLERIGIRGSRSHQGADARNGPYSVEGSVVLEPDPVELAKWFPRILGGTANGTSYPLAETVGDFYAFVDRVSKVQTYTGVKVNRATFSGSSADPVLRLSMELVGKTEATANAGTFPALTISTVQPYIFSDCVFTTANSARQVMEFSLTIDNALKTDRFCNSTTRTDIPASDRVVTLSMSLGYQTENVDLYDLGATGPAAVNSLVITNGNYSTNFTFGLLQAATQSPVINGRDEIMLPLTYIARKNGATAEITVTHDSTG